MRIRKRKMLFPQSSLPDPLVQFADFDTHSHPPPISSSTQDNKSARVHLQQQDCLMNKMQKEEGKAVEEDRKASKDTKNKSMYGAEAVTGVQPEPAASSSFGKRTFSSSKNRRGSSLESKAANEEDMMNESDKSKMKTKIINKKSVKAQPNGENATDRDGEAKGSNGKKKANRSGVVMEGSRCSRVNGRGWRCSQPTLVGYSLCEHHLGKGRLRSMNTVKGRLLIGNSTKQESALPLSSWTMKDDDNGEDDDDDDDEEETLMVTKKKIKLGMVKAKSISSLLGQTHHSAAVEANNGNK